MVRLFRRHGLRLMARRLAVLQAVSYRGDTPCLTAADDSAYEIDQAEVVYWGRCPNCIAATLLQPTHEHQ